MAKKKPVGLTADEKAEQATLEANVAAEEAAEPVAATIEEPVLPVSEPGSILSAELPTPEPVEEETPPYVPVFEALEDGRWAAVSKKDRELFYLIHGVRHEHVAEMPDGRWIYERSR